MNGEPVSNAAQELRRARGRAGLTQRELGRRADVTQTTVSMYETGRREPSLTMLTKLLSALGCHVIVEQRALPKKLPETARGRLLRSKGRALERTAAAHGLSNVRVFGSTARGDNREDSDVDLVVDVDDGSGLLALLGFADSASSLLGAEVDVVPYRSLKNRVRAEVDREAIPV